MNSEDIEYYYEFLSHDVYDIRAFTPRDTVLDEDISELQRVESLQEFKQFCEDHNGEANVYAGVLPKSSDGRKKQHVEAVDKVWIELDAEREEDGAASEESLQAAEEVMEEIIDDTADRFGQPLVVMSGNGYHLIWEVDPIEIREENRDRLDKKLNAFVHHFKNEYETDTVEVDTAVGELARILKIPGTKSVKGDRNHWRTSEIVHTCNQDEGDRGRLKEFFLIQERRDESEKQKSTADAPENPTVDDDKLQFILKKDERFKELFADRATDEYESRSEAEQALANKCAFYGFNVDDVLSQAHIGKWDEANQSYRDLTAKKAHVEVEEEYDWSTYEQQKNAEGEVDGGWENVIMKMMDSNTSKNEVRRAIADFLMEKYDWMAPRQTEQLWHFKNPAYSQDGSITIKELMWNNLSGHISKRDVSEITEQVMARSTIDREERKPPVRYIALSNGWYDVEEKEVTDPKTEYFMTNSIPVEYDDSADCPQFKEFVHDIVPAEDDVKILQEMFGYCLYRGYPLAKAFMLLGSGSNGKSTLLDILQELLGKDNVANEDLHDITDSRWGAAKLYRKLANVNDDLDAARLQSSGAFKRLVGGATVSAEFKGQDKFEFKNYAKLVYAANELPPTPDTSDAFFRRWIIIKFPNEYTENPDDGLPDKIPDLDEKIIDAGELPGILQWALDGLHRVLENNAFSTSRSREQIKNQWMLRTQPMDVYFENAVERKGGVSIEKSELYEHYVEFTEEVGVKDEGQSQFFKRLYSAYPGLRDNESRPRSDGRAKRLHGIATKEIEQVVRVVQGNIESNASAHTHAHAQRRSGEPLCTSVTASTVVEKVEEIGGGSAVDIEEVVNSFPDECEDKVEKAIDKAKDEGELFNPDPDTVKKL